MASRKKKTVAVVQPPPERMPYFEGAAVPPLENGAPWLKVGDSVEVTSDLGWISCRVTDASDMRTEYLGYAHVEIPGSELRCCVSPWNFGRKWRMPDAGAVSECVYCPRPIRNGVDPVEMQPGGRVAHVSCAEDALAASDVPEGEARS